MIGDTRHIKGSIEPPVSGDKLRRGWENRAGRECAPLASLKTDGERFELVYQTWDDGSLKHIFEIEVGRVVEPGSPSPKVTYSS